MAHDYGHEIYFDWTDVAAPNGIASYRLYVIGPTAQVPIVDEVREESEFLYRSCGSFVIDSNLRGWRWWVQPRDQLDQAGPSSDTGQFDFAPCRVDDGRSCELAAQP